MRKLIAIILFLTLTLGCLTALAEGPIVYATFAQTDIDPTPCLALFPEDELTIGEHSVTLPDRGYETVYYFSTYDFSNHHGMLEDGVWTFSFTNAPSDATFGVYATRDDGENNLHLVYYWPFEGQRMTSIAATAPDGGSILGTDFTELFMMFEGSKLLEYWVTTADGVLVIYAADGQLTEYTYTTEDMRQGAFDAQNNLIRINGYQEDLNGVDPADYPPLEIIYE